MFDQTSAEPSTICCCVGLGENHVLPSTTVSDLRILIDSDEWCRYAISCAAYGVTMFYCVTTAPQHQTFSDRFCVPFAGRVAGYATSRLRQRNNHSRRASCVPGLSTSVGAQCRRRHQTDRPYIDLLGTSTDTRCETFTGAAGCVSYGQKWRLELGDNIMRIL